MSGHPRWQLAALGAFPETHGDGMFVKRLLVRNFRNFRHAEVTLSAQITVVTGENNVGKSNLLYALRLVLDAKLGTVSRMLSELDFSAGIDPTKPSQILIVAEFGDVEEPYQKSFAGIDKIGDWGPSIAFRFWPGQRIRLGYDKDKKAYVGTALTIDDYEPSFTDCSYGDPRTVEWYEELGKSVPFTTLQAFAVEFLPALRDVEQDLRQARTSPLEKLLKQTSIPQPDRDAIEHAFSQANQALESVPSIQSVSSSIEQQFRLLAGDVTGLAASVGAVDPTFAKLARNLTIFLSTKEYGDMETSRNGLGVNNILYISMVTRYFRNRIAAEKFPGQLFLVDEPEAHLHPQAQRVLFATLRESGFQTVVATHSTHVASQADLESHAHLVRGDIGEATTAKLTEGLTAKQRGDIDRYLDASRSSLLFARRVILVEGPAELFVLPPLIKQVLKIDLDRLFITLVPIFGTHFEIKNVPF
jgi:putative ATP-dependent endonuclease of OLD family